MKRMMWWPDRVWECGASGLWRSRPATAEDLSNRRAYEQKAEQRVFGAARLRAG